jgi:hypothetical protein
MPLIFISLTSVVRKGNDHAIGLTFLKTTMRDVAPRPIAPFRVALNDLGYSHDNLSCDFHAALSRANNNHGAGRTWPDTFPYNDR